MIKGMYNSRLTILVFFSVGYVGIRGLYIDQLFNFSESIWHSVGQLVGFLAILVFILFGWLKNRNKPILLVKSDVFYIKDSGDSMHEIISSDIVNIEENRNNIRIKYVNSRTLSGFRTARINKSSLSIAEIAELHDILASTKHYIPNK